MFIQYYGFYPIEEQEKMIEMIRSQALKDRRKIKIVKIKKAGEIGFKKYRFRVDLKIIK